MWVEVCLEMIVAENINIGLVCGIMNLFMYAEMYRQINNRIKQCTTSNK